MFSVLYRYVSCLFLMGMVHLTFAQERTINSRFQGRMGVNPSTNQRGAVQPNMNMPQSKPDTMGFVRRDDSKNRVSLTWRYLDSTNRYSIDSSINDFDRYFPIPSTWQYLGNNGAAAFPLIFAPRNSIGFDPGFHAFDLYRFSQADAKVYQTNRPFSMMNYQLAGGKEQMISALHTQNPTPNLNFGFEYRLINAPGFFLNQSTNHNNIRFFSSFNSRKKRYHANLFLFSNNIKASENGGIQNDSLLSDPNRKKRFSVPVNMGGVLYQSNPFATNVTTGNLYRDQSVFLRQSYDFGRKDSMRINDSTLEFLFYPALRLQHSFSYQSSSFAFRDFFADSVLYADWYNITLPKPTDSVEARERWNILQNDLSLLLFPQPSNSKHFLRLGATWQQIRSEGKEDFQNVILSGDYQPASKNKSVQARFSGACHLQGLNQGDYFSSFDFTQRLGKRSGYLNLSARYSQRSPSFVFDPRSNFALGNTDTFRKENILSMGIAAGNNKIKFNFRHHVIENYSYFSGYYQKAQYRPSAQVLQAGVSYVLKLSGHWKWYWDATWQQTAKDAPIRVPQWFVRSRLAFEGIFFKNLNLCTGFEGRYVSPYKAPGYSPLAGQFFVQDATTISNLPDVAAFLHFRIRSFSGFLRAENLNTLDMEQGFSFTRNNMTAPHYPSQGLLIRFGIKWWFVN